MTLLSQEQAQDLIVKAWNEVSDKNFGSYRFGTCLWQQLMSHIHLEPCLYSLVLPYKELILFEPIPEEVTSTFYKYFVIPVDNQDSKV